MSKTESTQDTKSVSQDKSGSVTWRCPSNIALVKYWGKSPVQIPRNPSISFTLSKAYTETTISYRKKQNSGKDLDLSFMFEGKPNESFGKRIGGFLNSIRSEFSFLDQLELSISSTNSFPHSSGIASSASAMSAIAMCVCDIERTLNNSFESEEAFLRKASHIARLGSGSAARSVYSIAAVWGKSEHIKGSSDQYAIPFGDQIHPVFRSFKDAILIASSKKKSVSSTAGHELMNHHPYKTARLKQARENLMNITEAMTTGDLQTFGKIVEEEALTLHALMLTSRPSFILLEAATLQMIEKIRRFRTESNIPAYFTLDAGPNIHLLYPEDCNSAVQQFILDELRPLCENQYWIADEAGVGPVKVDA